MTYEIGIWVQESVTLKKGINALQRLPEDNTFT